MFRALQLLVASLLVALGTGACGTADMVTLNGTGATFPKAFYEASIDGFEEQRPGVTVNYGGGGSGQGRTDLQGGLVDFAGSDGLVKDQDRSKFKGAFLYIPTVAAPITVSYNLAGVPDLLLDAATTARIFQRDITSWDDPAIRALNPEVALPRSAIIVAHRSDGSGSTENFTKYLAKAAPGWRLKSGSTVAWPAETQAGNGNAGVAQIVKTQAGAIGYVDLSDAKTQRLRFAKLRNKAGRAVAPSLEATTKALEGVELRPDLTYDPLDSAEPDAYPIAAPTWVLVYKAQSDTRRGAVLKEWLAFLVGDGQELAAENDYAALPASFASRARAAIESIEVRS
jgi:phosphate transport system substrate-binding protein